VPITLVRPHPACSLILSLLLTLVASHSQAAAFTVTFSATVTNTSGDLTGPVSNGDTISGSFEIDDGIAGTFTASANPMFVRSEMLYTGAVANSTILVNGNPVSGTGGNVLLLDSTDMFAGEDNYEIRAIVDMGSIGGATPATLVVTPELDYTTFTIADGDPLFPPPFDETRFNPVTLTSATGGTAFAQIDTLETSSVESSSQLPAASSIGLLVFSALLMASGARSIRRQHRH
jgi:hypothetical protein